MINRALTIYDIGEDRWRAATQQDINRLVAVEQAYGKLRQAAKEIHHELTGESWLVPLGQTKSEQDLSAESKRILDAAKHTHNEFR